MNANELAEYYSLLVNHDKLYAKVVEQQAEIETLKKEKWLTEIDAKQQALKKIIDWLILEHDTLACTSYPIRKAQEK